MGVSARVDDRSEGWNMLSGAGPHDYDPAQVQELYQDALTAWRKNPIAFRIISITTRLRGRRCHQPVLAGAQPGALHPGFLGPSQEPHEPAPGGHVRGAGPVGRPVRGALPQRRRRHELPALRHQGPHPAHRDRRKRLGERDRLPRTPGGRPGAALAQPNPPAGRRSPRR